MKPYPAKIIIRLCAHAIDLFITAMLMAMVLIELAMFESVLPSGVLIAIISLTMLIITFSIPLCEAYFNGSTVGKLIFGIKTVRTDGSPVSLGHSLQRFLMLPFDTILTFGMGGLFCSMITEKRQRFGDLAADTMVVYVNPARKRWQRMALENFYDVTDEQKLLYNRGIEHLNKIDTGSVQTVADTYLGIECDLAHLRTIKAHDSMIEFFEALKSAAHIKLFKKKPHNAVEMLLKVIHDVPRAVYLSRKVIYAAVAISVVAFIIGAYSQFTDDSYFHSFFGHKYYNLTKSNMEEGDPMGLLYSSDEPFFMFLTIFVNNFKVSATMYISGILILLGPLFFLFTNFMMIGCFDAFFMQNGFLVDALIAPNEHGVLELTSIVMAGAAGLRLGTGWLFPGRLTRVKAFARSARQSILIFISTVPMLFVAAFIEGFITRHTEWPLPMRLGIITVSFTFIIGYYVMLPIFTKRH